MNQSEQWDDDSRDAFPIFHHKKHVPSLIYSEFKALLDQTNFKKVLLKLNYNIVSTNNFDIS